MLLERWVLRGRTPRGGARPWGNLFVNWTQAGQGDL